MGYYTYYNLHIEHVGTDTLEDLIDDLRDFSDGAMYGLEEDGTYADSCKWYEHEEDMVLFSKKHPKVVFKLEGKGEEAEDLWVKYFKNGKMQKCPARIVYDNYSEDKLTTEHYKPVNSRVK